ncbi:anti-sigma B factor RsbW [Marinicrinis sediminis]|uniref:Anti-sigma B factor RsbW n=1 Tax=Marinicrinis sediminis TaxID=1652465 RepID=A0ABW5R8N3_9BACL
MTSGYEEREVTLTFPSEAEYIDLVRLTLYGLATQMGFPYEEIEDMKVAVSEACNNAVLHGYRDQVGTVRIRFQKLENGLQIRIKDEGMNVESDVFAKDRKSLHDQSIDEISAGGLGIFMMQALMDEVRVSQENGTEVTLFKRFPALDRSESTS